MDTNTNESQNFWISYADLMAGLLFVFILIVGAIITKYAIMQSDMKALRVNLEKERADLNISKAQLKEKKAKLLAIENELKSIRDTNLLLSTKLKELKEIKKMYEEAKNEINSTKNILALKDDELLAIEKMLLQKTKAEQKLIMDLNITKSKIKNLTGIRIKVIKELKKSMGNMIKIDSKSGAITFSAKILFDQGEYLLKPVAKIKLKKVLSKYIKTLLSNSEIKRHIDKIIIEGHTNSDGGYFANLALSQKRAAEVMKFLYTINVGKKSDLKKYFTASGRSDTDLIYKKGKEDKSASRRIEIKFRIKNEDAIKEIERFLDK